MNTYYAFIITLLAGLSTMLGSILIFIKKNDKKILVSSLAFTSGVMLTISILDLIPEAINMLNSYSKNKIFIVIFIYSVLGVITASLIKKMTNIFKNNNLYKVGIITMIAIIIHNIPEGMATFIASNQNIKLGISLGIAIALHNIPEGISIAIPIYYASNNFFRALLYTFISGFSEFIGALITYIFLKPYINNVFLGYTFAFIAGIMIYIPVFELIPTSLNYGGKSRVAVYMILGTLIMIINSLLF